MKKHKLIRILGIVLLLYLAYRFILPTLLSGRQGSESAINHGEEQIVGWMIEQIAEGEVELSDENSVRQMISEGERKFDISLSETDKDKIVGFMQTLDNIEVGAEDFIARTKQMYQQYSTQLVEGANDAINEAVSSAAEGAAENFFESLKQSAQNFWENLSSEDNTAVSE